MTLHFVHIGKTGGTAIKRGLQQAGYAFWRPEKARRAPETPYGRIRLHNHDFRLADVPPGDHVFFCVRDPVALFVSGFYSRLNKGRPRYHHEWTMAERTAFAAFPTPQGLASALAGGDDAERDLARWAMRRIVHLGSLRRILGSVEQVRARRRQIVYIGRQETLADDWEQLKLLLGLPDHAALPSEPVRAHRRDATLDATLDDDATRALREWYWREYRLVEYCEALRTWNGWGIDAARHSGVDRLRNELRRLDAMLAVLPPRVYAARQRVRLP